MIGKGGEGGGRLGKGRVIGREGRRGWESMGVSIC